MLDRYTARALMDMGFMSSAEYLRLYGDEVKSQIEDVRREHKKAVERHEKAAGRSRSVSPKPDDRAKH